MHGKQIILVLFCSFLLGSAALGNTYIYDGLVHNYYSPTTFTEGFYVDMQSPGGAGNGVPGVGTVVNVYGARFEDSLRGWEDCSINIHSGYVRYLDIFDRAELNVYGGEIDTLVAACVTTDISAGDLGTVTLGGAVVADISGGNISFLRAGSSANAFIYGNDFAIDGLAVPYGEYFSITGGSLEYEPTRQLTGTLVSGDIFDASFKIGDTATVVLIPEPFSVVLLGCGALLFLRRRGR